MRSTPVASLDDPRIAAYHHVARPAEMARAGLFVAEGRFVVTRLLASDRFRVHSLLVTPAALAALDVVVDGLAAPVFVVDQRLMDQIVGFNMHRGCLALAERPPRRGLDSLPLMTLRRALVLEGVNNPDNVGGLFRSAAAFAADAVVLGPGAGDPLYRKAIRTSMAATLHVPFATAGAWPAALEALRAHGVRVFALTTTLRARSLDTLPRDVGRIALLVGSEGHGLSEPALAAADEQVRIATTAAVDSLNVTIAASIAMHYLWREGTKN